MDMLELVKISLWGNMNTKIDITEEDYNEMKMHAIIALPAQVLSEMSLQKELSDKWREDIFRQIAYYINSTYVQTNLPLTVPYIILKGTAAAQYYPYPEYRTMGDIDIMTRREDFDTACQQLIDAGYYVENKLDREISLVKNKVVIELHRWFAALNNADHAKYLDDLIIDNINPSHILPDLINGLVLLEHINQHLEFGLGLRQIIDWMLFVDKCLPDEKWPEFEILADNIGLKQLAIVSTHMCEIYLGLPSREWCAKADDSLCKQLMDYVLSSGNFGNKMVSDDQIIENVFAYARTPRTMFRLLQKQGLTNWKTAQKYSFLRPLAWIYQANRYLLKGLKSRKTISGLKKKHKAANKRKELFDMLGIKTAAKGIVVYKDGKYVKE